MHQNELNRAVARATGESVRTVARMGFIPLTPMPIDRDPLVVDWDELEAQRVGVPGRVRLRVEYHAPGDDPPEEISVPWEFLADCEARRQDPVQLEAVGDGCVVARWREGGIPQMVRYAAVARRRECPSIIGEATAHRGPVPDAASAAT